MQENKIQRMSEHAANEIVEHFESALGDYFHQGGRKILDRVVKTRKELMNALMFDSDYRQQARKGE